LCRLITACNFDVTASFSDLPEHQLWPPPEDKRWTRMDVIFFHGFQFPGDGSTDAWRSTWTQRGCDDVCWAKEWLPFDLGEDVRILSVSYNAHVITSPHHDVSEIAHNLFEALIRRCKWDCPIVLIGHSFGGLVLKSLVVKAKKMSSIKDPKDSLTRAAVDHAKAFLNNVRGVVFYAVPHAGSNNITQYVNNLLRSNDKHHARIMENVQPCRRDMEDLSEEFENFLKEKKVNVYAFGEGKPMNVGILVHFSSAQR
jgi:pimeloyl-ACP methyl ester carboxylesterase